LRGDATKVLDQRKGETERDVDDVDWGWTKKGRMSASSKDDGLRPHVDE
jgi:hypothetical protein